MPPSTTSPTTPTVTDQTDVSEQPKVDSKTAASSKMQNETIEPGNKDLWTTQNNSGTADQHLPEVTVEPDAPKLDSDTVQQYTHDLYEAVNGDEPDNEKISHLLESLNSADRKAIEEAYRNTNGNSDHRDLRTELKDSLGEEDYLQAESNLNKRDGRTNDAGNLMVSLSAIDDNRGDAERRVLETFSTLNAEQQKQLQDDFFKDYGKTVDQALEDFDLSDDAVKAVDFVSKPVEQRTAQDIEEFAKFAIDKGDLDYFSIAMRGDSPAAVEARKNLSNNEDFKNQIVEAFKVHQDGGTTGFLKRLASAIPGGEVVVGGINLVEGLVKGDLNFDRLIEGTSFDTWKKAIESKEVDSKLLQAMDILHNGQVSLATVALDNTGSIFGWFDNKDAIANAAEHATDSEKKLFSRGQELAQGGAEPQSEEDKTALDFYNRIHDAFNNAGDDSEPLKWEDKLLNGKDGSIISQFADDSSKEGKYTAVESLSQKDWEKLKDPEQGAAFRKQIETYLAENGGDQDAQAVLKLLDEKLAAGTYEDSQKVLRSLSDLVTMSPDAKTSVATIAGLRPEEAAKYQTDSAFRAQVDQFVKDKLDDLGQVAATKLLSQIATTGKPPEQDAIDKLFSDKLNDAEGKDAIADIEAVLQDSALRQKLAGPEDSLNDIEKQLKKTIEGYIDAATPDSPTPAYGRGAAVNGSNDADEQKDNEYLQALYQNGRLTVDQKAKLNLRGENFFTEAATASPEERQELYDSGLISAEEKQLIDTLTGQGGEMSLADKIRGAVIKDGTDAELFEDELKVLSAEDKQKLKDEYAQKYGAALDEDVLAHVSDEAKNNFRSYLTAGEVDGRQDFYDNLKAALYSESGYSPDGSQEVLERALSTQAAMLSDFQARFEKLPPEKQAEANQLFTAALKDYQESKEACAEKLYQAAVIVGGIAVGVATGGVGLVALASVVAIGAAGRIALKKAIQGNDYELTLSNVLKDGAIGGATAGLSVLGPETFAAFKAVGSTAAKSFMSTATPQVEQLLAKQGGKLTVQDVIKNDAMATLNKQLNNVIASSVVRGESISEPMLSSIVAKTVTANASPELRAELTSILATTLRDSGRKVVTEMVNPSLSGMARQATTYGMLGGTTNVAIESTVGLANGHFDASHLPQAFLLGFGMGSGMSVGLETALRGVGKHAATKSDDTTTAGRSDTTFDASPNQTQGLVQDNLRLNSPVVKDADEFIGQVLDPKTLSQGMDRLPNSAEFRDLVGSNTVGSIPREFLSGGLTEAQAITKLNSLATMLRELDCALPAVKKSGLGTTELNMGEFQVQFGSKEATVQKIGIGEVAHVYKVSIDGKDIAFKVPNDPARTDVHGIYAEAGAYTFLAKQQIKDLTDFYSANPSHGWMMTEYVSKPVQRPGQAIEEVLAKYNLQLADDWSANRGPGNVVWDLGGIEPAGVMNPHNLDEFKALLQTPEGRMVAGRRVSGIADEQELKEALLLTLDCPAAAGQAPRSAVSELFNDAYVNDVLSKALETPGAAGRAAFELSGLSSTPYFKDLMLKGLDNPESRIEAIKHLDKLKSEERYEIFKLAFAYPECRAMATRSIQSILDPAQRTEAVKLALQYPDSRYVLLRTQPGLAKPYLTPEEWGTSVLTRSSLEEHLASYGLIEQSSSHTPFKLADTGNQSDPEMPEYLTDKHAFSQPGPATQSGTSHSSAATNAANQNSIAAHSTNLQFRDRYGMPEKSIVEWSDLSDITDVSKAIALFNGPLTPPDLPNVSAYLLPDYYGGYTAFFDDPVFGAGNLMVSKSGEITVQKYGSFSISYEPKQFADGKFGYLKKQQNQYGTMSQSADGTMTYTYHSGHKIVQHNGTLQLTTPSGEIFPAWHLPKESTTADGTKVIEHGNGTIVKTHPDGTEITHYPNNAETTIYPDGTIEITHADGATEVHSADGTIEKLSADNALEVYTATGKDIKFQPDGQYKIRDHASEMKQNVEELTRKINEDFITDQDVQKLLNGVAPENRDLALAFINAGLQNTNDRALMESMRSIKQHISAAMKKTNGHFSDHCRVFSLEPGGMSDVEAYLFRKASNLNNHILDVKDLDIKASTGEQILIFGDLSKASRLVQESVKNAARNNNVININLSSSKSLNFIDFATEQAGTKLQSLIMEARAAAKANRRLRKLDAVSLAQHVLHAEGKTAASQLNIETFSAQPMTHEQVMTPPTSEQVIQNYLNAHYPNIRDRARAARLLNHTAQYTSFAGIAEKSSDLHEMIIYRLGQKALMNQSGEITGVYDDVLKAGRIAEKDAIYIVGDSSDAMISAVYRQVNNIDPRHLVTLNDFRQWKQQGLIGDRQIIYLDDTAYSGDQLGNFIAMQLSGLETKPIVGNFGSYSEFGIRNWSDPNATVELISLAGHIPLSQTLSKWSQRETSQVSPSADALRGELDAREAADFMERTKRDGSYQGIDSYQIFPFMTSDTSAAFLKEFAVSVLGIHNPQLTDLTPAKFSNNPLAPFSQFKWIPPNNDFQNSAP